MLSNFDRADAIAAISTSHVAAVPTTLTPPGARVRHNSIDMRNHQPSAHPHNLGPVGTSTTELLGPASGQSAGALEQAQEHAAHEASARVL
jgi:hypothetical protein